MFFFSFYFRLKKASTSSEPVAPSDENVYNPSRDLYNKSTTQQSSSQNSEPIKDCYSPSQDVEDLYRPPPISGARPQSSGSTSGSGSGYNPRNDLINNQQPGIWDTNYDSNNQRGNFYQPESGVSNPPAVPVRGDPRANRRDPRRRD